MQFFIDSLELSEDATNSNFPFVALKLIVPFNEISLDPASIDNDYKSLSTCKLYMRSLCSVDAANMVALVALVVPWVQ